ncbi:MAG: PKD domain-containing protein [Bacteroidales bacterium]|nr:PKD domain-containing protein [Bacteroidales bacterium]
MIYRLLKIILFLFSFISAEAQVFYRADRIDINTSTSSEMAPTIYNDGIIFSSNRKNDIIMVTVDQSGNYMYNLYYSKQKSPKNWSAPVLLSKLVVSRFNESSASVSADKSTLYYTATLNSNSKIGDQISGDTVKNGIFIARWDGFKWNPDREFPYNSNNYDVAYPCINEDGTRLYFASRNPEGFGGFDLYYADMDRNRWQEPVNLGPEINTPENEVFPFVHGSSRLYFASRGHEGQGGLDIFYTDYINGKWTKPVNMPRPFNSRSDDFAFVSNAAIDTGYFTSNRRGSDDIFKFTSSIPIFTDCPMQVEETFCYEFYESGSMKLDTTTLRYEWDMGDGTKIRETRVLYCYEKPGYYLVQLNVIDTLTGEVYYSEASYDLLVEKIEQPYIISPDTFLVSEPVLFNGKDSHIKEFTIQDYYWDFGDGTVAIEEETRHTYNTAGNYMVRLGVTGPLKNNPDNQSKACVVKQIIILNEQ